MTHEEAAAPQDPPHPLTDAGLARLMLSHASMSTAEHALGGVATSSDVHRGPGAFVEHALKTLREAEEALHWAVVYERERGSSWDDIGEALGPVTRQSAHRRFADGVERWRAPLDEPETVRLDGTAQDPRIPYPASDPERAARHLDRWVRDHSAPYDSVFSRDDEHPVSGHLDRHITASALMILSKYTQRLLRDQMVPDPHKQADAADYHADLLERLVREGKAPAEAPQWIAQDRARAAALRRSPGGGVDWDDPGKPDPSAAADADGAGA